MNKFLITIIVPNIEYECDLFIPNNKKVGTIKSSILESLKTLTNGVFNKTINDVKFIGVEPSLHQINQTMWNYRVREWMSLRLAVRRRCSCIFTTRRS